MSEKDFLYSFEEDDLKNLTDIELESYRKANELNDKILDLKILVDDINYDWDEYLKFLEEKKISKICEFRGETCIDFNEELLAAIVNTLKNSINDTNKSIKYNSKKIAINRVING